MAKHMKRAFVVRIHRVMDVYVPVPNGMPVTKQGHFVKKIGEELAGGRTDFACMLVNEAMCGCNDELADWWPVECDGFYDLYLTDDDCKRLTEEE